MKHIRTSALVAAVMIGSAAFAASVSADSSVSSTERHQSRASASGSYAPPETSGIVGEWQEGNISLRITTGSGSDYAGTFRIPASQEGATDRTGSLIAVDNSDGTYSMTFTDMATGASQTSLFTLADGRMTGTLSFDGASSEMRLEHGHGDRGSRARPESAGSGSTGRARAAADSSDTGTPAEVSTKTPASEKAPLSEKVRTKLDAKLDAVDMSKRQAFYEELLRKLDILLSKSSGKERQKALIEGVRDHVRSRLDSEFGTAESADDGDDAIETLLGQ